jgi:hypothetical protein
MPQVKVSVTRMGDANIEVEGVTDGTCLTLTQAIETGLGASDPSRDMHPETGEIVADQQSGAGW